MADQRLTDKTELITPAADDLLEIVDISDPTSDPAGTTKKIQLQNLIPQGGSLLVNKLRGDLSLIGIPEGSELPVPYSQTIITPHVTSDILGLNTFATSGIYDIQLSANIARPINLGSSRMIGVARVNANYWGPPSVAVPNQETGTMLMAELTDMQNVVNWTRTLSVRINAGDVFTFRIYWVETLANPNDDQIGLVARPNSEYPGGTLNESFIIDIRAVSFTV